MRRAHIHTLLLTVALTLPAAAAPLFEVLPSTRQVTCMASAGDTLLVGTTGGLVLQPDAGPCRVLLPGVPVRALTPELVAADDGLYRLEGGALTRVTADATSALSPAAPGFLESDGLWTGHPMGRVRRWREGAVAATHVFPTRAPIHSVVEDGGDLLAASVEGLWRIRAGKLAEERLGEDPLTRTVMTLRRIDGRVLAGTPLGLHERVDGRWRRLDGPEVHVTALARRGGAGDEPPRIVVGTAGDTLHELVGARVGALPRAFAHATALAEHSGTLQVGTPEAGLWHWPEGAAPAPRWDHSGEPPGNTITALAHADAFGTLVVGTFDHGLGLLQEGRWRHFGVDAGLPSDWINHVSSDGRRVLVRFSDGRVYTQIERRRFRQLGAGDGWPKNWSSAVGSSRGRQWVGTYSAFYLRGADGWDVFAPKPTLDHNLVLDVALTEGEAWIATHRNGLYRWDALADTWSSYSLAGGLPDTWVTAVETFRGEVWVGTFDGGVARLPSDEAARRSAPERALAPSAWRHLGAGPDGPLPSRAVNTLLATDEEVWIGTLEGLVRSDGETHRAFGVADGLPSPNVLSLARDGEHLWVGTESGLCRAPLAALRP